MRMFTAGGNTALGRGADAPKDDFAHIWAVGRGMYAGGVTDWFHGWIDEVRICDEYLAPTDFLFAARPDNGHVAETASADRTQETK